MLLEILPFLGLSVSLDVEMAPLLLSFEVLLELEFTLLLMYPFTTSVSAGILGSRSQVIDYIGYCLGISPVFPRLCHPEAWAAEYAPKEYVK